MNMAAHCGLEESDSENDGSSLVSDWTEQSEPRDQYPVDHVLAQREDKTGQPLYLVKWTGYPETRSTWEPSANLGATTIEQWLEKTIAIRRGFEKPFDTVTWEEKQAMTKDADSRRWKQRVQRLAKQGRPTKPPKGHPAAEEDAWSDEENPSLSAPPLKEIKAVGVGRKSKPTARSRSRVHAAAKKKQGKANQVEQMKGAEIMAKFGDELTAKRKKKLEEGLFRNISHQWNVEKRGRDGTAPKAEDILLFKPGEIHKAEFIKPGASAILKEPSPTETRRPSVADRPPALHAGNIPLSCFYWSANITCLAGEGQCHFVHGKSDRIAKKEMHDQLQETGFSRKPKYFDPTQVCYYWGWKHSCHHGDSGCWFAHWWPSDEKWIMYEMNDREKQYEVGKGMHMDEPSNVSTKPVHRPSPNFIEKVREATREQPPRPRYSWKIQKPCPFFLTTRGCKWSDEDCQFLHTKTDIIASAPTMTCSFWLRGNCYKGNACLFKHEDTGLVAPLPFSRGAKASYTPPEHERQSSYDSYRPGNIQRDIQPHVVSESTMQLGTRPPPSGWDLPKAMSAPSPYFEDLARHSEARAIDKATATQAQSIDHLSQSASGPEEALVGLAPLFLAETETDSSETMDIDSDSVGQSDALDISLEISAGSTAIAAQIIELDLSALEILRDDFSATPHLVLSNICLREFLGEFVLPLAPTVLSTGKLIEQGGKHMLQLANTLNEQRSAAFIQGRSSLLVLYPSCLILSKRVFLERTGPILKDCHICIDVRAAGSHLPTAAPSSSASSLPKTLERLFLENHGWKSKELFAWQGNRGISKNVYIMAHPMAHKSETEILARYFRELQARVWLPGTKGSWNDFLKLDQGVIIFHPDFNSYEGIPKLSRKLIQKFNIFQIEIEMKNESPSRLNLNKIMSRGTCTLLVDEMYIQMPQASLDLLRFIAKKNEGKKDISARTWGVYGRPLLSDFLLEIASIKHEGNDDAMDTTRTQLFDTAELLDTSDPGAPLLSSNINVETFGVCDFDELRKTDPAQAAWKLLEAFAIESLNWTDDYRRVVVVYPPTGVDSSVRKVYEEWEASPRAQHISFMDPGKFMRTFQPT